MTLFSHTIVMLYETAAMFLGMVLTVLILSFIPLVAGFGGSSR